MSPFYQDVDLQSRERISLAPGSYGTSTQPGLKILSYIDKASKLDKNGAMRHSFLVAATRPSREQLQKHASGNGKAAAAGDATPFDEPDYDGTAFFEVTIHDDWKHPAALALAFTEASRNKEGKINHDYVAEAITAGEFDSQIAKDGEVYYRKIATDKVIAANTPGPQMQEAIETQYRKELIQISIKMGKFFTLQDWIGVPRDPNYDPINFVGTEFSGTVETRVSNTGKSGSEVTGVRSRSKPAK